MSVVMMVTLIFILRVAITLCRNLAIAAPLALENSCIPS
jgi:hypothetical protein